MRECFFRVPAILPLLLAFTLSSCAQSLKILIPEDAVIQHAGSIGYFSIGGGYELFKNNRGSLDFNYGYVPASKGGELHIVAAKFAYRPFEIKLRDWAKIYPLNPGFFLSYTFHNDLGIKFPTDQYPKGYYYWSEAIRPHLSLSNEFQFIDESLLKKTGLKAVTLYSEINSNDYYLINFFQNPEELSVSDVFKLGIGLRLKF